MATAKCPECEADVEIKDTAEPDEEITCDDCGADLYIAGINPIELELADVEDDFDDDDEDEY